MDKKYLTISEFAKLRNISIGSLRYYEELKILVPARIDPKTKYRYYLPEQLAVLDTILMCIEMNIPLKELKNYTDENGYLDQMQLMIRGKKVMQEKIAEMQAKLEIAKYSLDSMERNQKYSSCKEPYTREIEKRFFLEIPIHDNFKEIYQTGKRSMDLFQEAQEKNMSPVFPAGIILHYEREPIEVSFYLQVLHPDKQDQRIVHLPKARYLCLQTDLTFQTNMKQLIEQNFQTDEKKMIIIANMIQKKLHFGSRHSEIQMPIE